LLADGRFHSEQALARALDVSRSAVHAHIARLSELELEVHRVRGRGYRLAEPLDLLKREAILAELARAARARLAVLEILPVIDSTNAYLMQRPHLDGGARACLAELQSAGRGRRGRSWLAPFAGGICLSLSWRFASSPPALTALGLAVAVMAAGALEACGMIGLGLKWPNDLLWRNRKLGGVLIEMQGEPRGSCRVVAGIGINVKLPADAVSRIGQPVADVTTALAGTPLGRSRLAGQLLNRMLIGFNRFEQEGFEPFRPEWLRWDQVIGHRVHIEQPGGTHLGAAIGVDRDGALLIESGGSVRRHFSGDVTIRAGAPSR
jgi:BirA family biotin operon repressor/biotin-[acetyl-CoA-carboxylase] ligase